MSYSLEDKRDLKGKPGGKVKSVDIQEKLLPEPEQKQRHRQGREMRVSNRHTQPKDDLDKEGEEGRTNGDSWVSILKTGSYDLLRKGGGRSHACCLVKPAEMCSGHVLSGWCLSNVGTLAEHRALRAGNQTALKRTLGSGWCSADERASGKGQE
uniref:Uncharacterized protein n=1 Tax=Myotis myotis TaxID=51298 RepID=A0A7J7T5R9_MYOMY|nr:hypothetical protein mMyoMyo1_009144 [Myotis myotis]